jgi:hypothetical protein
MSGGTGDGRLASAKPHILGFVPSWTGALCAEAGVQWAPLPQGGEPRDTRRHGISRQWGRMKEQLGKNPGRSSVSLSIRRRKRPRTKVPGARIRAAFRTPDEEDTDMAALAAFSRGSSHSASLANGRWRVSCAGSVPSGTVLVQRCASRQRFSFSEF